VVDSDVIRHIRDSPAPSMWHNNFREDFDGLWFVDYLNAYVAWSAPNIVFNRTGYRLPFERIRTFLLSELGTDSRTTSIRTKHLWLAKYFNSVVQHAPEGSGVDWVGLTIPI